MQRESRKSQNNEWVNKHIYGDPDSAGTKFENLYLAILWMNSWNIYVSRGGVPSISHLFFWSNPSDFHSCSYPIQGLFELLGFSSFASWWLLLWDQEIICHLQDFYCIFLAGLQMWTSKTLGHKHTSQTLQGEENVACLLNLPWLWSKDVT